MLELSTAGWALVAIAALVVGISKTGVPGIGILAVVVLVFAVGAENAKKSVGLLLPALICGDIIAVAWYRRHAQWKHLLRLLPPAALGIVAGFLLALWLKQINQDQQLGRIIGAIVLAMLILKRWWDWRGQRAGGEPPVPDHISIALVIGALAGVTTMLANAAGPLLIIYLLAMRLDKHAFIGTAAWYFLLLNVFKVPFMSYLGWITLDSLKVNLIMLPMIVAGAAAGIYIFRKIPQRVFAITVEVLAALAAIKLVIG